MYAIFAVSLFLFKYLSMHNFWQWHSQDFSEGEAIVTTQLSKTNGGPELFESWFSETAFPAF